MPRMPAPSLPVLSLWAAAADAPAAEPSMALDLPKVPGCASTPRQALDNARDQFPGRDVLVLHANAELPADALHRLQAALAGGEWDVVFPVDGHWRLFNDGLDGAERDLLAWRHGEHAVFAQPESSSVCALWRAHPPPGEQGAPLRAGLLPCLYVGPSLPSLGGELPLPLHALQLAVAGQRPTLPGAGAPVVLHVLHDWGGGVECFVRDLQAADTQSQHLVLVARGDEYRRPYGRRLCLHASLDAPPLQVWPLASPIFDTAADSPEVAAILAEVIGQWGVGAVLVSSLIGHALEVLRTGLPTAMCVHDTYPIWPLLHDARDPAAEPFDLPELERGLAEAGPGHVLAGRDAAQWWSLRADLLRTLAQQNVTLVAPSDFARQRMSALAPELSALPWRTISHGHAPLPPAAISAQPKPAGAALRVLVPGRLEGGKGEHLLAQLLPGLPAGVELKLLGSGGAGARFEGHPCVSVQRDYGRDQLAQAVATLAPDVALLASTAPETFSYTLSEMLALGIPVVCASPGAPAARLRELGLGWQVAADATAVNALLAELAAHPEAVSEMRSRPKPELSSLSEMAEHWRQALPVAPTRLQLRAATPAAVAKLGLTLESARRQAIVDRRDDELREAWLELDRRADWAHGLQRQVQELLLLRSNADSEILRLEQELHEAQLELDRRADWAHGLQRQVQELLQLRSNADSEILRLEDHIGELDQQLAQAHGYYQRDSTDLARQRDVAVSQRDAALETLRAIQGSLFWRVTVVPRGLASWLRHRMLASSYHLRHCKSLLARGRASLRNRGWAGTLNRLRERRATLAEQRHAPAPLAALAADSALRLPRPTRPMASIVVPVHGQLHFTLACLRALSDCADAAAFEVIVVDDASTDASPRVLPSIPGLRYHRNPQNLGFIGACNAGAELATGEFVVFLNNDTTVQPGWLDALLETFHRYPDTGLAGSKLVYPDGLLQEAGGIVFADGTGWNYGRFEDPAHPRYGFVREVDYCSGAALAIRRELFLQLGGFDSHYAPAYYEDTDLAMRVRAHGLKVRYQPASVVVHHEGVTSGTDVRKGVKAYQLVNQKKFLARWREVLAADHAPAGTDPVLASERNRSKRVLVLDACTPTPDRDSGSVRMLALLALLREEGCSVAFFPENRAHDGAYTEAIQQLGVEAWWHPYIGVVPAWLAKHGASFDLVIASRHYVLSPLLPLIRSHARRAHLVFDTVDLHHLREQREAEVSGDAAQRRTAARTRRMELGLIGQADTTWVVSSMEQALLASELPQARVEVVSNIHEVHGAGLPWEQRSGLLFVGSYRHPPNVDAARWLATEILPEVRAHLPDVVLHLVGADAPDDIVALGALPGVQFHGYVPDLLPLLEGARVGVAPLRYGAGVKGKVNQSLAHGQPMVATVCAVEGMHLVDGQDVLVADDASDFAQAVVRLYQDPALWQRLAQGGMENTRRFFSREAVRLQLRALLASLGPR